MILLDTNVLGRMTDAADPQCAAARRAVHSLLASHDLVRSLGITGIRSHDARLVAPMQTYGIERLLTFNAEHFQRFSITVIEATELAGGPRRE